MRLANASFGDLVSEHGFVGEWVVLFVVVTIGIVVAAVDVRIVEARAQGDQFLVELAMVDRGSCGGVL
jgi:hypothetical protein